MPQIFPWGLWRPKGKLVLVYFDDIFLYSLNKIQLLEHLANVLKLLVRIYLIATLKCCMIDKLFLLGYAMTAGDLQIDFFFRKKVKANFDKSVNRVRDFRSNIVLCQVWTACMCWRTVFTCCLLSWHIHLLLVASISCVYMFFMSSAIVTGTGKCP